MFLMELKDINIIEVLFPLALILLLSKLLSIGARKLGLPQVIGLLITGVLLGCIIFIPNQPIITESSQLGIGFLAEIGVILIMFSAGMETNLKQIKQTGVASIVITVLGVIVPMALRILYGCGTRLSETMSLRRKDVDFKNSTIFLKKTKFGKERLIPIHETLLSILERYCMAIGIMYKPDAYLFPGRGNSTHLCTRQMDTWFSEILQLAGIDQRSKEPGERGACIHCLRHLFVMKAIRQLEEKGRSIYLDDLLLPTYLGHEHLLDTDKYMRFSGVQVPDSLNAFESFSSGLIPEVEVPYEEE